MPSSPFRLLPPLWFAETPSTNDILKKRLADGEKLPPGTLVAAHRQTRGKGRLGSVWQSSQQGDLTFSFYWECPRAAQAATLPMACALAVRDFLAAPPLGIATACKWPNDVLVGDAKICGILAEGSVTPTGGLGLVIGIGVNLRNEPGRDVRLGRPTAAIEEFVANPGTPESLLPVLAEHLNTRIARWEEGGFPSIREDLRACLWGMGRRIAAKTTAGKVEGVVAGLGDGGEILLRGDDGAVAGIASVTALEGWDTATGKEPSRAGQ